MNKIALLVAAVGVAGFTGGAFAQTASTSPGAGAPTFDVADANHDGFVDVTEAMAAYPGLSQKAFDQVDTNKDGKLTADEYNGLGGEGQYSDNKNASGASSK
jgi:EF hand